MRQFTARLSRSAIIGIVAVCAIVAAGGLAAASFLGTGPGGGARTAAGARVSAGAPGAPGTVTDRVASAPMPQIAAAPQMAVMPKSAPGSPARAGAPASGGHGPAGPTAGQGSHPAPSNGPGTEPPAPAGTTSCAHPSYVTSAPFGMWNLAPYFVYNDMWNASAYQVTQTLYACSYSNWYVVATMNNNNGDGAVKTYPDAHRDFSEPRIASLRSVSSTFAETSPGTGIYEDAYDIWLNGVASSGSTEVMIWTENHGQVPSGSDQGTVTFGGRSYTVWRNGSYIAFVANANFTSGTMNLLEFFQWLIAKGWIPANSTLGAVDYGVELVSTNGVPATFTFTNFSVTAS